MTIRVMKAFEIEANYQRHKQKLTSIGSINAKKKVVRNTGKNMQAINYFKKQKLTSDLFHERQRSIERAAVNNHIRSSLIRVYNRKFIPNNQEISPNPRRSTSRSSARSSTSDLSRLKKQNSVMKRNIERAKSDYSKFRLGHEHKSAGSGRDKDELIRLLQNQLGIKPKVVFPYVKANYKSKQDRSQLNQRAQKVHRSVSSTNSGIK